MKGKATAKLLLPLVIAIWAMIGWKVYAAMNKDGDANNVSFHAPEVAAHGKALPDSVVLIANYRDPFLDKPVEVKRNASAAAPAAVAKVKVEIPSKPIATWPKLGYYGLIKRNGDAKTVGFLSVDGESHFVQSGTVIGEVKVLRMWKDSVEVVWGKERRVVGK